MTRRFVKSLAALMLALSIICQGGALTVLADPVKDGSAIKVDNAVPNGIQKENTEDGNTKLTYDQADQDVETLYVEIAPGDEVVIHIGNVGDDNSSVSGTDIWNRGGTAAVTVGDVTGKSNYATPVDINENVGTVDFTSGDISGDQIMVVSLWENEGNIDLHTGDISADTETSFNDIMVVRNQGTITLNSGEQDKPGNITGAKENVIDIADNNGTIDIRADQITGTGKGADIYRAGANGQTSITANSINVGEVGVRVSDNEGRTDLHIGEISNTMYGPGIEITENSGTVNVNTGEQDAPVNVDAKGDGISVENNTGDVNIRAEAVSGGNKGIGIDQNNGTVNVQVDSVYGEGKGGDGGISVVENGEDGKVSITAGKVTAGAWAAVEVSGNYGEVDLHTGPVECQDGFGVLLYGNFGTISMNEGAEDEPVDISSTYVGIDIMTLAEEGMASVAAGEVKAVNTSEEDGAMAASVEGQSKLVAESLTAQSDGQFAGGLSVYTCEWDPEGPCNLFEGNATVDVTVNGSIRATGCTEETGVIRAVGISSSDGPVAMPETQYVVNLTVDGDVVAKGKTAAGAYLEGNTRLNMQQGEGNIIVEAAGFDGGDSELPSQAVGLYATVKDGGYNTDQTLYVRANDIQVTGHTDAEVTGIIAQNTYEGEYTRIIDLGLGDVAAVGEKKVTGLVVEGAVELDVGSISAKTTGTGEDARAIGVEIRSGDVDTSYTFGGNVTAEGEHSSAVYLNANGSGVMDVLIDGDISGHDNAVLIAETTTADNLELSVWKLEENDDGQIIGLADSDGYAIAPEDMTEEQQAKTEELEKDIWYIIRIAQPTEGGKITATQRNGDALTEKNGKQVAKQDDEIALKLELPEGYILAGAYSDQELHEVLQDTEGNYYMVVPRGGGVEISMKLEKKPAPVVEPERKDQKGSGEKGEQEGPAKPEVKEEEPEQKPEQKDTDKQEEPVKPEVKEEEPEQKPEPKDTDKQEEPAKPDVKDEEPEKKLEPKDTDKQEEPVKPEEKEEKPEQKPETKPEPKDTDKQEEPAKPEGKDKDPVDGAQVEAEARVMTTITYYLEGGSINGSSDAIAVTAAAGNAVKLMEAPEREGYEFLYWNIQYVPRDSKEWREPRPERDKQYKPGQYFRVPKRAVTVSAVWQEK